MPKKIDYPAHIIAGRGRKIELIDGTSVTLVYGFASIMQIEEEFDSIDNALGSIESGGLKIGRVAKLLAAGLLHEGHATGLLSDIDVLAPLLDSLLIEDYGNAIGEAFVLSFPQPEEGEAVDPPVGAHRSPGETGTTPQPSSLAEPMQSSGA